MHEIFDNRASSNEHIDPEPRRGPAVWIVGIIVFLLVIGVGWYGFDHGGAAIHHAPASVTALPPTTTPPVPAPTPKM